MESGSWEVMPSPRAAARCPTIPCTLVRTGPCKKKSFIFQLSRYGDPVLASSGPLEMLLLSSSTREHVASTSAS
eukprot:scaffold662_cov248-Pinguiococcus_pyrenoidosus.AAC.8